MALSSSCHPLVVHKPHSHSCCGTSLQRQYDFAPNSWVSWLGLGKIILKVRESKQN